MFTINGERLTFALTNDQDKQFSINASTEDEKHWELQSIDENSAKLFTNGEYPLAALKTIVENILIRQINDPDITVNISQVKEDLLVIITLKEKWVERKITLQFDSKKRATEIERLESLLAKTRRESAQTKETYDLQILQLQKEIDGLKVMLNQTRCLMVQCFSLQNIDKVKGGDVCFLVLPKGCWLVTYTFTYEGKGEIPVVVMYDSLCPSGQPGGTGYNVCTYSDGFRNWRYNCTVVVQSTGEGRAYLHFGSEALGRVSDIVLYALPISIIQ
jgi:hypothetical protein